MGRRFSVTGGQVRFRHPYLLPSPSRRAGSLTPSLEAAALAGGRKARIYSSTGRAGTAAHQSCLGNNDSAEPLAVCLFSCSPASCSSSRGLRYRRACTAVSVTRGSASLQALAPPLALSRESCSGRLPAFGPRGCGALAQHHSVNLRRRTYRVRRGDSVSS